MSKKIMTLEEIMEDKNLAVHIAEDIADFPADTEVSYEVWAIGYDEGSEITDTNMFISEFNDPDMAIEFAKKLSLADIVYQAAEEYDGHEPIENVAYISIEVETVIEDVENDETMNIGTIYKRELWIDGESDTPTEDYYEAVPVTSKDYQLLDDGSLEIGCDVLKNFNKNDMVQICFTDENNKTILTYKIISKTTANKFICEFIY